MTKEEYIKTLHICGHDIDLGLDDYGQCYFIEWTDENGEKKETGLGTYNFHYLEEVYCMFDPRYKGLLRKDMFGDEMTEKEKSDWAKYEKIFEEEYKQYDEKTDT